MTKNETDKITLLAKDQYAVAKLLDEILEYSRDLNRVSREVVKTDADTGTYLYHLGQEIDDALMTLELVLGIDVDGILSKGKPDSSEGLGRTCYEPGNERFPSFQMRDLEESFKNQVKAYYNNSIGEIL